MSHTVLIGKRFNDLYTHKLVKLTNGLENHNGYQFQTGLNVDSIPFNPKGECRAGGIYFCSFEKLPLWLDYDIKPMIYARLVTIPHDALVWVELDKFKADRLILGQRQKICDLEEWKDSSYCLEAVKQNGQVLEYVIQQTEELCLLAVKTNALALQYVKEQTEELCLKAVQQDGSALVYVIKQTMELCLEAVKQDGIALEYVKEQTPNICLAAVKQNGFALTYVTQQTPELCLIAVKQNGCALMFVRNQTDKICLAAITQNSSAVQYVVIHLDHLS